MRVERVRLICTVCGFTSDPHRTPQSLFMLIDAGKMPATIEGACSNCNTEADAYSDEENEPTMLTAHFVDRSPHEGVGATSESLS